MYTKPNIGAELARSCVVGGLKWANELAYSAVSRAGKMRPEAFPYQHLWYRIIPNFGPYVGWKTVSAFETQPLTHLSEEQT